MNESTLNWVDFNCKTTTIQLGFHSKNSASNRCGFLHNLTLIQCQILVEWVFILVMIYPELILFDLFFFAKTKSYTKTTLKVNSATKFVELFFAKKYIYINYLNWKLSPNEFCCWRYPSNAAECAGCLGRAVARGSAKAALLIMTKYSLNLLNEMNLRTKSSRRTDSTQIVWKYLRRKRKNAIISEDYPPPWSQKS